MFVSKILRMGAEQRMTAVSKILRVGAEQRMTAMEKLLGMCHSKEV